jgi:hypothetical protein
MSTEALRLQLSRRKGFDLQKTSRGKNGLLAVVVSRPSKWGNPYPLGEYDRPTSLALFRRYLTKAIRDGHLDLLELRGRNVACWCKLSDACHGDILLEFVKSARNKTG